MKKKIRLFGDIECEDCIKMRNITEKADIIQLDNNVEIEVVIIDDEPGKTEWEKVMKKTGVYFGPHMEITWYDEEIKKRVEAHLSNVRDFETTEEGFEMLSKVLAKNYLHHPPTMDTVEVTERIKSLTFMQEILYKKMQSSVTNFTNIRDFINIPGSKIEL